MVLGLGSTGAFCGHEPFDDPTETRCAVCDAHGGDAWPGPERPAPTPEAVQAAPRLPPPAWPWIAPTATVSARAPPTAL